MIEKIRRHRAMQISRRRMLVLSIGLVVGVMGLALVGCGGGDDGDGAAAPSAAASQQPSAPSDSPPEPTEIPATPELEPAGPIGSASTVVNVTQNSDFSLTLDRDSVPSGEVTFIIQNDHALAHEFVVMRSDLEVFDLKLREFTIDPTQPGVEFIGELTQAENPPGEVATLTVSLAPGRHLVSCLADSHYQQFHEIAELQVN